MADGYRRQNKECEDRGETNSGASSRSIDDVHWVFGDNSRKHPRGLKVFKWIRGKK